MKKNVQKHVTNGDSVDKSSAHVSLHVGDSNPSPHTGRTAKIMSGVETPNKSISLPNCIGSDECVARVSESSRPHIQDSNPSLIANTAEVECNAKVPSVNRSPEIVENDESLYANANVGLNELDSNPKTKKIKKK